MHDMYSSRRRCPQAVLAYRVPLVGSLDRPQRKIVHAALHSAALLCIVLALVAAFQSHNLKKPTATPNLYSPHSYLGLAVTVLAFLQARAAGGARRSRERWSNRNQTLPCARAARDITDITGQAVRRQARHQRRACRRGQREPMPSLPALLMARVCMPRPPLPGGTQKVTAHTSQGASCAHRPRCAQAPAGQSATLP